MWEEMPISGNSAMIEAIDMWEGKPVECTGNNYDKSYRYMGEKANLRKCQFNMTATIEAIYCGRKCQSNVTATMKL